MQISKQVSVWLVYFSETTQITQSSNSKTETPRRSAAHRRVATSLFWPSALSRLRSSAPVVIAFLWLAYERGPPPLLMIRQQIEGS